jgi:hypothetical protein
MEERMPDIEMPPQYAGSYSDPQDTEGHVRRAIEREAGDRLSLWTTLMLEAVDEFETAANLHIDELEYEHDVAYDFSPVLTSFASAAINSFPPTAAVTTVVTTVLEGVQSDYEDRLRTGLSGAKLQLHASVAAFAQASRKSTTETAPAVLKQLPEIVEDAMTWVDSASTDPEYVGAMCDWMGFALPTRENTVNPVRQALENPFFGIYQSVRAQLLRIQGVPGLDDDDLSPVIWEHDAVERERELYRVEGPDAWKSAYEEAR